ncbi:MAG: aldose 1-epimerase [Planctomycetales bacterium]
MSLESITLQDPHTGSQAKIAPGCGFNCFSFRAVLDGEEHEVLWSSPDFLEGTGSPSGSGIPLLFPFPGRLRGTTFSFEGKQYPLTLARTDALGNAIHGFALNRAWEVAELTETKAVGIFHASQVEPKLLGQWPSDFRLTATYELSGNTLSFQLKVENVGESRLPFGFGTHPYFRVPLANGSPPEACRVTVPASGFLEMIDMIPTGKFSPATGPRDVRSGVAFPDAAFDDLFNGLEFTAGTCSATLSDSKANRSLAVRFGEAFPYCVVYNPPHREAICLEPYTCLPDAYALAEQGVETGLRVLAPEASFTTSVVMEMQ